jgi:DOPA 4,5-dioxygenase
MTAAAKPNEIAEIVSYHAHIYFDSATAREVAAELREQISQRFSVQVGRWHDVNVGPHTRAMYQVAFGPDLFEKLVPWLMLNARGLSVLIHPNTDSPHDDHLEHALWLGDKLDVNADKLPHSMREAGRAHDPIVPNTQPRS